MYKKRRFAKMYATYTDDIFRFIYVRVRDEMLAEDLTADTFSKAWQKLETFDFRQPRAWLYTIARNLITDHWRTHHSVPLEDGFDPEDDRESVEAQVDRALSKERLTAAIGQLPEDMKSVVSLRFLQGFSARQTGDALGIAEGNVRIIQYRALKKLKGILS